MVIFALERMHPQGRLLGYWLVAAIVLTVAYVLSGGLQISERTRDRFWMSLKFFYALPFFTFFAEWLTWDTLLAFSGRPKWRHGPMNLFHAILTLSLALIIVMPWRWFQKGRDEPQ